MQELFRGYIPTNEKSPKIKFKDVDVLPTLSDVQSMSEYAGVLADNVVLIDVDDYEQSERLMDIVEALQINCRVYATTRGKHFFFYGGDIGKCGTHLKLAIGLEADIKVGDHNSISVLKYGGKEREIIYDIDPTESYDPAPKWLTPVKTKVDFLNMESGDGRNQTFFNYILTLQSAELSNEEIKTTINLINKYILPEPLEEAELNKILRDESFKKPNFFGKNGFQHNAFGNFLINNAKIVNISKTLHVYKDGIYLDDEDLIKEEMVEYIPQLKKNQRAEVLDYIKLKAPKKSGISDANYIAFRNGLYNVSTGQLEDFNPDVVIKNKIPWDYNYDAYNADLDAMLDRISCYDDSIRDLLEEMAGYCMYRRNELRKAFILIGDKANGKSTYLDAIGYMLGDINKCALDLKDLGDRFRTAQLFGKLVNIGDDIGDKFITDTSTFKKLVSGDEVTVERKGEKPFEIRSYAKLLFSANTIPRMKDETGAVLSRLVIIPFNATFSRNDPNYDPHIKYKIRSEGAMEYFIQIALDGLKRVLDNRGFTICEKVQSELNSYNEQNNPIIGFFGEVDIDIDVKNQPTKDVYTRYKLYCSEGGFTPLSHVKFSQHIKKELGLVSVQRKINGRNVKIYCEVDNG